MSQPNTLRHIAQEFNYPVAGSVRANRYGGTFDADEPESPIAFLRGTPGLTVVKDGNRLVIRARQAKATDEASASVT